MSASAHPVNIARVYDPALPAHGTRVLIDRLWPRGIHKEEAPFHLWLKDAAPSNELRRWFGHDPARWDEFRARYEAELAANPDAVVPLLDLLAQGPLTLLYAAKDEAHNNAVVLADYLQQKKAAAPSLHDAGA